MADPARLEEPAEPLGVLLDQPEPQPEPEPAVLPSSSGSDDSSSSSSEGDDTPARGLRGWTMSTPWQRTPAFAGSDDYDFDDW